MATHDTLTIVYNGQPVLEYDREQPLPEHQLEYLDKLDTKMSAGLELDGHLFNDPNQLQRGRFIANHLIQALLDDNQAIIAASCAYLAKRLPQLKQVKADDQQQPQLLIELIFDRAYTPEQKVQFVRPEKLN